MHIVQNQACQIETYDENALKVLQESVFCASIQTVPETLPTPIPKTIPKNVLKRLYKRIVFRKRLDKVTSGINAKGEKILKRIRKGEKK